MLKLILPALLILTAFPIGVLLAKLTKEELKQGRKYFNLLIVVSILLLVFSFFVNNANLKYSILFTSLFIMIVTGISIKKSY